jgi:hypothetical protein
MANKRKPFRRTIFFQQENELVEKRGEKRKIWEASVIPILFGLWFRFVRDDAYFVSPTGLALLPRNRPSLTKLAGDITIIELVVSDPSCIVLQHQHNEESPPFVVESRSEELLMK